MSIAFCERVGGASAAGAGAGAALGSGAGAAEATGAALGGGGGGAGAGAGGAATGCGWGEPQARASRKRATAPRGAGQGVSSGCMAAEAYPGAQRDGPETAETLSFASPATDGDERGRGGGGLHAAQHAGGDLGVDGDPGRADLRREVVAEDLRQ